MVPLLSPRGESAKSVLKLTWDYPVYRPKPKEVTEGSTARSVDRALTREEAMKAIAGDDPRPLLVLRECKVCNGTDDALLKGGPDNEKTFLLARWFHCVKLPVDVMNEDHPFHNAFTIDPPEHLFVCSIDGTNHDPLESDTSRVKLWESMKGLIKKEYKGNSDSSVKKIAKIIDRLDVADERYRELKASHDAILEKEGPDSRKLAKFVKDLNKCEAERLELNEEIAKATELELKRQGHEKEIAEAKKKNEL